MPHTQVARCCVEAHVEGGGGGGAVSDQVYMSICKVQKYTVLAPDPESIYNTVCIYLVRALLLKKRLTDEWMSEWIHK